MRFNLSRKSCVDLQSNISVSRHYTQGFVVNCQELTSLTYGDNEEQVEAMMMKTMVEMHGGNTDDGDERKK